MSVATLTDDGWSLASATDTEPAYQCYLSLGFVVQDYPDDAPMPDTCYFLTRSSESGGT